MKRTTLTVMAGLAVLLLYPVALQNCSAEKKAEKKAEKIERYREVFARRMQAFQQRRDTVGQKPDGTLYVPDQFVVWHQNKSPEEIKALREKAKSIYGERFSLLKNCGCKGEFEIELWQILGHNEKGDPGSEEATASLGHEELEENIYLGPDIPFTMDSSLYFPFDSLPANFVVRPSPKKDAPVVIAVLDTGIDPYFQDSLVNGEPALPLWSNPREELDGKDAPDDPFCLVDDIYGWDFVKRDNYPMDGHSHGTHIAGIIAGNLRRYQPDLHFQLMAVKVLDDDGAGSLFDAGCGIVYAAMQGAHVLNCSWGTYGSSGKRFLRAAFLFAQRKGVNAVNSAGNEGVDISFINHYPTQFALTDSFFLQSMAFAVALGEDGRLLPGANFRTEGRAAGGFIGAPGENILSLIPRHLQAQVSPYKTGSSSAAPHLTAIVAAYRSRFTGQPAEQAAHRSFQVIKNTVTPLEIEPYEDGSKYPYYPVTDSALDAVFSKIDRLATGKE